MLHVDINKWHVDIIYLACRGQKYGTIENRTYNVMIHQAQCNYPVVILYPTGHSIAPMNTAFYPIENTNETHWIPHCNPVNGDITHWKQQYNWCSIITHWVMQGTLLDIARGKKTHNSLDKNHIKPQTMGDPIYTCNPLGKAFYALLGTTIKENLTFGHFLIDEFLKL